MNTTTSTQTPSHTCYGQIFRGRTKEAARQDCPACTADNPDDFDCTVCGAEGAVIVHGTAPNRVAKCDECGQVSEESPRA